MSKENVVLFVHAANKDSDLRRRVYTADTTIDAWMQIGRESGFSFTADEFKEVIECTLGRPLKTDNAVREYLLSRNVIELGEEALDQIVGGAPTFQDLPFLKSPDKPSNT